MTQQTTKRTIQTLTNPIPAPISDSQLHYSVGIASYHQSSCDKRHLPQKQEGLSRENTFDSTSATNSHLPAPFKLLPCSPTPSWNPSYSPTVQRSRSPTPVHQYRFLLQQISRQQHRRYRGQPCDEPDRLSFLSGRGVWDLDTSQATGLGRNVFGDPFPRAVFPHAPVYCG